MNRLILPKIAVLLILVVLIGRLYQLQLIPDEADRFRDSTRARTTRFLPVRPILRRRWQDPAGRERADLYCLGATGRSAFA